MTPDVEKRHQLLQEEVRGLKDVLKVAQVVVSSLDLDAVLENILKSAMDLMEVPAGSIALYDNNPGRMTLHADAGLSATFLATKSWPVEPGGLTERILREEAPLVIEDTREASFFNNPMALGEGILSLIAVPLKIQSKIVGMLYLDDFEPRRFPPERLKLLPIIASFAAMSIDNARLHWRTRQLASTDGLTGLYNYRQFKELFHREMQRAERFQTPLSLVMFDVDDFKLFNDSFGHPLGDRVLVNVADILRQALREMDLICRYGGEEFVAILPETDLDQAVVAAERVRTAIEADAVSSLGEEIDRGITVSAGVASFPRDGKKLEYLLKVCDDLLYGAKKLGKNKVYFIK